MDFVFIHIQSNNNNKKKQKQYHIKPEVFCTAKALSNRVKRQPTMWKRMFASQTSDTWLASEVSKVCKPPNSKEANDPVCKMGQGHKMTAPERRSVNGQGAYEKMLSITHCQEGCR